MSITDIYQTLEDRGNYQQIEDHGPYFCSLYDESGELKKGIKEPWLGEGYYFWDTRIDDARWWGYTIYEQYTKGYVICHTCYDQHSSLLFDMVGSLAMFEDFLDCAKVISLERNIKKVSFPVVLEYLKRKEDFNYKAIRVWPDPKTFSSNSQFDVPFPGNQATIRKMEKIQICFFDKTLLNEPFVIVEKHPITITPDFTI